MNNSQKRFAFVAVLGAPNAGKSTLVNRLVGTKVSIVSPKVQTTRSRIRGIMACESTQIVLVDTPGIFKASQRFDRAMVASAWTEAGESDLRLLVVDAKQGFNKVTAAIVNSLVKNKQKAILVLNKIDEVSKDALLPLIAQFNQNGIFMDTFMISARTGENVDDLKSYLFGLAPVGMWMFPDNQLTDLPDRLFAAEVTREKLFLKLQQELPYHISVETTSFQENEKSIRIEQTIYVAKTGQRSIVLGHKGEAIKSVGSLARKELTGLFGKKVHLFLFVKVKEKWQEDPSQYTDWGLDFNA